MTEKPNLKISISRDIRHIKGFIQGLIFLQYMYIFITKLYSSESNLINARKIIYCQVTPALRIQEI